MNHDEFVKLLAQRGEVVYIVDKGIVYFAKFTVAALAIFGLVGIFFFSTDIKNAREEAGTARLEMQKTLLDIQDTKNKLDSALAETKKAQELFEGETTKIRQEMQLHLQESRDAIARTVEIQQQAALCLERVQQSGNSRACASVVIATTAVDTNAATAILVNKINIGVVSEVPELQGDDLSRVVAALQKQVSRDLKPIWNVDAALAVFKTLEDVPQGYWPLLVKNDIGIAGAAGMHKVDKGGTPFALVTYTKGGDWTLTASFELVDMLVDPQSSRFIAGPSLNPDDNGTTVNYLVEVAQPVGGGDTAYKIDGVLVTDFVRPEFYGAPRMAGSRYDFAGALDKPLKVMKSGYLSWVTPTTNEWFQIAWFSDKPTLHKLGKISAD